MHRIAFAILALFCSLPVFAAPPKPKLAEQYKRWLDQDVVYIITDEERKGFLALTTDDQREKFIEDFWQVRNPKHGSDSESLQGGALRAHRIRQLALRPSVQYARLDDRYGARLYLVRGAHIAS